MSKTILFVNVEDDGAGDFYHLSDIFAAMQKFASLKDHAIVPIIGYGFKHSMDTIEKFRSALKTVKANDYFLYPAFSPDSEFASRPYVGYGVFFGSGSVSYRVGSINEFTNNSLIQQHLSEATQIIIVSSSSFIPIGAMKMYARADVEYKYIGEHEKNYALQYALNYPLGLGDSAYGIKIKTMQKISPSVACEVFAQHDQEFHQALLHAADCSNIADYCSGNMLIPAYFSETNTLIKFILFLANNEKLLATTNLHIYLSGSASQLFQEVFLDFYSCDTNELKNTNIKHIVMLAKGQEKNKVTLNPQGTRSVLIFVGYYLSDASYMAINQQAAIAGVSGDNSFELAAGLSLPYYHSTNYYYKRDSLQTLEKICDELPTLPPELKADFKTFFSSIEVWNEERDMLGNKDVAEVAEKFKKIDLPGMIEHWHLFSEYLHQNYNFYNKLEDIILNKAVKNNKEYLASLQPNLEQRNFKKAKFIL